MRRLFIVAVALALGPWPVEANYCRPEWQESIHYPQFSPTYSESWLSPETVFAVIATAIAFFILGRVASLPSGVDKGKLLSDIDKIFAGRKGEADTHGKLPKLDKPLDAAHKGVRKVIDEAIPS